jgi:hypothetical protein
MISFPPLPSHFLYFSKKKAELTKIQRRHLLNIPIFVVLLLILLLLTAAVLLFYHGTILPTVMFIERTDTQKWPPEVQQCEIP